MDGQSLADRWFGQQTWRLMHLGLSTVVLHGEDQFDVGGVVDAWMAERTVLLSDDESSFLLPSRCSLMPFLSPT